MDVVAPVTGGQNADVVVVIRVDLTRSLYKILGDQTSMGLTGESLLVRSDQTLLSTPCAGRILRS